MRTLPFFVLLSTGLLAACGGKKDESSKPAPADTKPKETAADTAKPDETAKTDEDKEKEKEKEKAAAPAHEVPRGTEHEPVHYETYNQALREGRRLVKEKKAEEAKAAFLAAIEAKKDSAVAYSELSWVLFTMKDYQGCIEAAHKSIEVGSELPIVQSMSHYNMGRAHEEGGNKEEAIKSYTASFQLRQNKIVGERLDALGAERPKSEWKATALQGPFKSLAEYCAPFGFEGTDANTATGDWCETKAIGFDSATSLPSWVQEIGSFEIYGPQHDQPMINLAIKTDKGWYVKPDFEMRFNRYDWHVDKSEAIGERLVLHHQNEEGRFESQVYRFQTICGLGSTGALSCYGPIQLFDGYTGYEGSKERGKELPEVVAMHCKASLSDKDMLTIDAEDSGCKRMPGLVGDHLIVFP